MQIRIGIIDDNTLVREGVKAIVQYEDDMELIHESDSYAHAKKFLDGSPDINIIIINVSVLVDMDFSLVRRANRKGIKSIVINLKGNGHHLFEAKKAGANGLIHKGSSIAELLEAIRAVNENETYFSQFLLEHLNNSNETNPFSELTIREINICRHILDGVKIKRIASLLDISPKTVYVHKANAYRKLRINSTQMLFALARENGVKGHI